MNIPLAFGNYKGQSGAMELVNMMAVSDQTTPFYLAGTPGCKEYIDLERIGEGRGGFFIPGYCLAVVRDYCYIIDISDGTKAEAGTLETITGAVQWAENPDQVMLIDSTNGYVYTKATKQFKKITDADFPIPTACDFKDGYGVVVEKSTGKFYVSDINDFTSWDALSFTTAEYEPDNLVSCLASHDSLYAFGVKTTQTYYNSGNSTFPFDNRPGANMQIGCGAKDSPAKGENIIFWLDNHGLVRKLDGYSQVVISTRQIEYIIANLSTFSDARGNIYVQEGHTFYVLSFPTDSLTLVYDVSTEQWHKRTSSKTGRWRPAWIAQQGSLILAGDFGNGKVYQLDTSTFTDDSEEIAWFFTLQDINDDDQTIAHDMLSIKMETGVGLISGQGSDPKIWMQYSDDDGDSWSKEKWRSLGKIGKTKTRIRFFNLGQSRSRVYRIGGTDPVKRLAISAKLEGRAVD